MKVKTGFALLFLIAGISVVWGCSNRAFELGSVDNGVYRNNYFGFSLDIPSDMAVHDVGLVNAGQEDDKRLMLNIIRDFKDADSTGFTYNLNVTSEKLGKKGGPKTAQQYLVTVIDLLEGSLYADAQMQFEVSPAVLGGKEFSKIRVCSPHYDQDLYITLHKGYALTFATTFCGYYQQKAIENILGSVKFD